MDAVFDELEDSAAGEGPAMTYRVIVQPQAERDIQNTRPMDT